MSELGSRLDRVRVLVVDDDATARYVTCHTLPSDGAIVTECVSARQTLEILCKHPPDVLVSDLWMPGEDGFWLVAAVRALSLAQGGGTPAAALTGHLTADGRARVLRAGFQFQLLKPVEPERLVGVVAILARKA